MHPQERVPINQIHIPQTLNPKPQELTSVTTLQNGFDQGVEEVAHWLLACKGKKSIWKRKRVRYILELARHLFQQDQNRQFHLLF